MEVIRVVEGRVPQEFAEIVDAAVRARMRAYAPYSKFLVGAAVRSSDGRIFTGSNVENAMYEVGHAEQSALFQMVQAIVQSPCVAVEIAAALVAEQEAQHAMPCGFCRQWIREFGSDATKIYGVKLLADGTVWAIEVTTLGELLPFAFGPENLTNT